MTVLRTLPPIRRNVPPPFVYGIFCFGRPTSASLDAFGIYHCDLCGRAVAVAW